MKRVRKFEFATDVSYGQIMKTIVAALDDEGLRLTDTNTPDRITTVITGGMKVAILPLSRISGATPRSSAVDDVMQQAGFAPA